MSFTMLESIQNELYETCTKIPGDERQLTIAMLKAWSFVDVVHRIRELSSTLPGLSTRTPALLRFLKESRPAEDFRNYIQHLRGELMEPTPNTFPVWGAISWIDPVDPHICYSAHSGTSVGSITTTFVLIDTHTGYWVSRVALNCLDKLFHFDLIFDECMQYRDFILPWILQTFTAPLKTLTEPIVQRIRCDFLQVPVELSNESVAD